MTDMTPLNQLLDSIERNQAADDRWFRLALLDCLELLPTRLRRIYEATIIGARGARLTQIGGKMADAIEREETNDVTNS